METVMLVDDSAFDNFINQKVIENEQLTDNILVYDNPFKALSYLTNLSNSEHHFVESIPSVIFLDNVMPDMDGISFLKEFDRLPTSIKEYCKIVFLTSAPEMTDRDAISKNVNVLGFLEKPLTRESLLKVSLV
jgi:CheY-like chemotaxis protein